MSVQIWVSLPKLVMTMLRCCQLLFFCAWMLRLQYFQDAASSAHCVPGRTADFRGAMRTVIDSIRRISCKVGHVQTVWNTIRMKVLGRKWWGWQWMGENINFIICGRGWCNGSGMVFLNLVILLKKKPQTVPLPALVGDTKARDYDLMEKALR